MSAKTVISVVKDKGQSWNGEYFRSILTEFVIPFMQNPDCVVSVEDAVFLHDKARCMSALQTQDLLQTNGIDFFGNNEWPANSPDLNPTENLGAILKDRVESKMLSEPNENRLNVDIWKKHINDVLEDLRTDKELLTHLLTSLRSRLDKIASAGGGRIQY